MFRSIPVLICLFFAGSDLIGQVISIKSSNGPVEGAVLQCPNGSNAVSSPQGYITFSEDIAGCRITHLGYEPFEITSRNFTDTLEVNLIVLPEVLPDIVIQGFQQPVSLANLAGGYSYLPANEIRKFSMVSPVSAFNSLPGVRMEQRSPASYRLNIRGSTLRSPFGVRNVKVYWNFIPLTEATGNTPLNLLDLDMLGNVQIIRGPSGSLYGAGNGGVLLMENNFQKPDRHTFEGSFAAGSFGMRRLDASYAFSDESNFASMAVSGITADGYRDHSRSDRKNITVNGQTAISENQSIRYYLLFASLFYELPGGLTAEQFENEPTMARAIAIEQNSLIDQKYLLGGLEHSVKWKNGSNTTSFFFSSSDKENPFITNYEFEDLRGGGMRTRFSFEPGGTNGPWKINIGGEWQWGKFEATNFGNSGGQPDTLRYSDSNKQFTGFEYGQISYVKNDWRISLSGSLNHLSYRFDRLRDAALDSAYTLERDFETVFNPRLGIVKDLGAISVHASYSQGFSPPGLDEIRTSDASINTDLQPEDGENFEVGLRGNLLNSRLAFDLNLFLMNQSNTIVSRIDENGTSTFQNRGKTRQAGIEVLAGYRILENWNGWLSYVYLKGALSIYDFKFTEYSRAAGDNNEDFSGNELTGTPGLSASFWLTARFAKGIEADLSYQHVSQIPLNDANSVYSDPYDLLQLRIAWEAIRFGNAKVNFFAGVDNLLNQRYSLGNDLNAFGGRYFNPASERNYFAGARLILGSPAE